MLAFFMSSLLFICLLVCFVLVSATTLHSDNEQKKKQVKEENQEYGYVHFLLLEMAKLSCL